MMVRFQLFPTTSYGKYETIDYPRFDFILTIPFFTRHEYSFERNLAQHLHHLFIRKLWGGCYSI